MTKIKTAMAAAFALGAAALLTPLSAQAMPVGDPAVATANISGAQNVGWVCGPYRCWWRPNYFAYGPRFYYGPPRFYGYGPRPFYRFGYRRWGW